MQPDEIESWYDGEKQKTEEEFLKGMEKGGDTKALRAEFDKKLKAAITRYTSEYRKILKPSEFSKKRKKFAKRFMDYEQKVTQPVKDLLDSLTAAFKDR